MTMRKGLILAAVSVFALAACMNNTAQQDNRPPTATLASNVSMTPRFTATPIASRTPLPTFTFTPSESPVPPTPSDTPSPTEVPPVIGIVASLNTVNVREGPGTRFSAFAALTPGTRVEVLGQNAEGNWYNIALDDGRQGWMAASLVRLQETPTPLPTLTPTPNLTAIAQGTPLPTSILGGGTVTPTPPLSAMTPTPVTPTSEAEVESGPSSTPFLPVINVQSINQTATALVSGGVIAPTESPSPGPSATPNVLGPTPTLNILASATALSGTAQVGTGSEGNASAQQGVDVLAYCNERSFGRPAPANLAAGSTIDVWWSWFAQTRQYIQDHLDHVTYEVALDGVTLDYRDYRTTVRQQNDGNYYVYWYVPAGPLTAGPHEITYRVFWDSQITDGYDVFGPGTANAQQTGNCTFTVSP